MKHHTLYDTGRFNVSRYREYDYFHHETGMTVAVLPILVPDCKLVVKTLTTPKSLQKKVSFPKSGANNYCLVKEALFGFRQEDLPCWQASYATRDLLHWTCVTGGVDPLDDSIAHAMYRELREEMGLVVHASSHIFEGPMFTNKGSNVRVMHFVLMVMEGEIVPRKPDSTFDANAEEHWMTAGEVQQVNDFDLHSRHLLRMFNASTQARDRAR